MSAAVRRFDWKRPDYLCLFRQRTEALKRLRANPKALAALRVFYKEHPAQFITDWGMTHDPRNIERGLPASVPFVLFPRQVEFIEWVMERWRRQESGLCEKSRDCGISWLAMSLACTLAIFHPGLSIGAGSRKESLLDNQGDPSSLFFKARMFLDSLPNEFRPDYTSAHMRLTFPNGSSIVGEAGDQIGRGGRASLYLVDEAAYLEQPDSIEASLAATTNCRIDVSSVNGLANPFARKRFSGKVSVFTFMWTSDPRKGPEWYAKQVETLDPVTVASEINIDYRGSVEGQLIPSAWIQAAIGAHLKLGITPSGGKYAGLDVADEGRDLNAFAARHGVVLQYLKSWSGKGGDIYQSVIKAFDLCDELGCESFFYDADGLGSGVRGDANVINEERIKTGRAYVRDTPFRGSEAVWQPDSQMVPKRFNKDLFANKKAQSWWALRLRFQQTHRAINERLPVGFDDIISIDPDLPELLQLTMELSQPTYKLNNAGKIIVEKAPDGTRSPNLADAVMIAFNPATRGYELWAKLGT
jgi:phage terminase large subunit